VIDSKPVVSYRFRFVVVLTALSVLVTLASAGCENQSRPTSAPLSADGTPSISETLPADPTSVTAETPVGTSPGTPQSGGTLVIGLSDAVLTWDPADYRHRETETVLRNVFDGLVTRTTEGKVVPEIAESYHWVDDRTLEFVLRPGIIFHNGEDLTADDVKFTFDRVISENGVDYPEPHTASRKALIGPLRDVEVVDDYTVRLHFESVWPVALQMLVHQQILPQDYFQEVGTQGFIQAPVGCGPFKFVEGDLNEQIVLERFADYYGGAPDLPPVGPAFVDRLIFRVIKDAAERVKALQAGEVDIIQSVPSYLVPSLSADPNVVVKTGPGTRPYWMEMNVQRAPFDDERVRQAMNYAIDVDLIVGALLGGRGRALAGPLSPYNQFVDPSLKPYGYNLSRAIELLNAAGYMPQDISFVIDCRESDREYAEAVATQLREWGMDVTVQVWDYDELNPLLLAGERMAYVGGWGDSAFDPVGHFEAKWHTWVQGSDYGRGNFSTYSNAQVDELIVAGEAEPDVEKRRQIYAQAQQIIYREAPAVFLFLPDIVEASSARVQGWSPSPDGRLNMHDVWLSPTPEP